jgi:hypothetical protein
VGALRVVVVGNVFWLGRYSDRVENRRQVGPLSTFRPYSLWLKTAIRSILRLAVWFRTRVLRIAVFSHKRAAARFRRQSWSTSERKRNFGWSRNERGTSPHLETSPAEHHADEWAPGDTPAAE